MKSNQVIQDAENFLRKYVTFAKDYQIFPMILWCIATHTFDTFDSFPMLEITAGTKRSGKTRLLELVALLSSNYRSLSPDSVSSMYRYMDAEYSGEEEGITPVMGFDEAEKFNQENHAAREFLNKGYRKGQYITRTLGEVKKFPCYCPKIFCLIGDVYDTLFDRCIIVKLRRRTPIENLNAPKFRAVVAEKEAGQISEAISQMVKDYQGEIESAFLDGFDLSHVNDRDAEIWQAIFSVCKALCPEKMDELMISCVDMCTEKSAPKRRSVGKEWELAEKEADDADARIMLLMDMLKLSNGDNLPSADLPERLKAIPTAQWRKYKGENGINSHQIGYLLDALSVGPEVVRVKGTSGSKGESKSTFKAYKAKDLQAAAHLAGIPEHLWKR